MGCVLVVLTVGSCAGEAGTEVSEPPSTTTPVETPTTVAGTTTTIAAATSTAGQVSTTMAGETTGGGTVPSECLDVVQGFLQEIEPIVSTFDFQGGDIEDYLQLLMDQYPALTTLAEGVVGAQCGEMTQVVDPEMAPDLLAWAEQNAPGTVAYLEIMTAETPERGNDCQAFIDTMQGYVDQGGAFADLEPSEKHDVANLYAAITSWCGLQTAGEYLSRPEVEGFLGITVG
jgi:hypothetical protein